MRLHLLYRGRGAPGQRGTGKALAAAVFPCLFCPGALVLPAAQRNSDLCGQGHQPRVPGIFVSAGDCLPGKSHGRAPGAAAGGKL